MRARILFALLDGREIPASELAARANASAQSASGHLRKLVAGGLIVTRAAGRQRLFHLASPQIAHAIEILGSIAPVAPIVSLRQHTTMQRLREARSCYDHFAGRLGVAITESLTRNGAIELCGDEFTLSTAGRRLLTRIGVDVDAAEIQRRSFARACIDWTERRPHLAGSLGAALLSHAVAECWVRRHPSERSLQVTSEGKDALKTLFGIQVA